MAEKGLSGKIWPIHLKPKNDELLSSLIFRLAMSYGIKLHTFCSIVFPGISIWNRDIDKCANENILRIISDKTATNIERIIDTTLKSFEGSVFEKLNPYGNTRWIMPIGVYHRIRKNFGLQFCPVCLNEDAEPYFRKHWRLAFISICPNHKVQLHDKCMTCGEPINFHRDELGQRQKITSTSITSCHNCKFDFRKSVNFKYDYPAIKKEEIDFQTNLSSAINEKWIKLSNNEIVYSLAFFPVLNRILTFLATGNKADSIRMALCNELNLEFFKPHFPSRKNYIQFLSVRDRRMLLILSYWLLSEWPYRFIEFCNKNKLKSSFLFRDIKRPGYWYYKVIHEYLYKPDYTPSDEEILTAVQILKRGRKQFSLSDISSFLGCTDIFRKRKISAKLSDLKILYNL